MDKKNHEKQSMRDCFGLLPYFGKQGGREMCAFSIGIEKENRSEFSGIVMDIERGKRSP